MTIRGNAVVIEADNVDTDVLYPGPYLNIDDPEKMKDHLFDGLDPALRTMLGSDTVLVVGDNFGTGSSREHVPLAMKAWGIQAVLGKSFARIFYRNCINLALPVFTCPEAVDAVKPGSIVAIAAESGDVTVDGASFRAAALPPFILKMILSGGLVKWVRGQLTGTETR